MVKFISLFGLPVLFVASFLFTPHVFGANSVYISEVNYNGSSVNGGDKWVELYNPTNSGINLAGWKLSMPNSSKTGTVALSGNIAANSTFVVGVKNAKFSNLYSGSDLTNYNITNISNTQANEANYVNIQLIDNAGSTISQIQKDDSYVKSLGISGKGGVKHSLECDLQGVCNLSDSLYGGTGLDFGTPGVVAAAISYKEEAPKPVIDPIVSQATVNPATPPVQVNEIAVALQPTPKSSTVIISEPVLSPSPVTVTISPVSQSTTAPLQVSNNFVSSAVPEPVSFTIPSISIKPTERVFTNDLQIPEIKLQTLTTKSSPVAYKSLAYPEVQLLSLIMLTGYTVISKAKIRLLRFVNA
jgi:Lamin Tail Domain